MTKTRQQRNYAKQDPFDCLRLLIETPNGQFDDVCTTGDQCVLQGSLEVFVSIPASDGQAGEMAHGTQEPRQGRSIIMSESEETFHAEKARRFCDNKVFIEVFVSGMVPQRKLGMRVEKFLIIGLEWNC